MTYAKISEARMFEYIILEPTNYSTSNYKMFPNKHGFINAYKELRLNVDIGTGLNFANPKMQGSSMFMNISCCSRSSLIPRI